MRLVGPRSRMVPAARLSSVGQAVEVATFVPTDQPAVRELILDYLADRFGGLDATLNRDLDDIAASYADGHIVVARSEGRVVGVGILVAGADQDSEIKRMCVARGARRQGVGTQILRALIEHARGSGVKRIDLYTATSWDDAVSFYAGAGFTVARYEQTMFTFDAVFTMAL